MTPDELEQRISIIRNEIQSLVDEVNAQVPGIDRPDTERLIEAHYQTGSPAGLAVALEALPDVDAEGEDERALVRRLLRSALDPAETQRQRRDRAQSDAAAALALARERTPRGAR